MTLYGGIELGGTNIVCAYASHPTETLIDGQNRYEFRTTSQPQDAVQSIAAFFSQAPAPVIKIGVASFGPIDIKKRMITTTPKLGWRDFPLIERLQDALPNVQFHFESDVNGAAVGEWRYGAGKGLSSLVYVTIGTGIGGGIITSNHVLHGNSTPEMGHIPVKLHPYDLEHQFSGNCIYHQTQENLCLEGLASGEAIKKRWGWDDFKPSNPNWELAWEVQAFYVAQLATHIIYMVSPERIILGGGVILNQLEMLVLVRKNIQQILNGYVNNALVFSAIDHFIVAPALGDNAGIVGALSLAYDTQ